MPKAPKKPSSTPSPKAKEAKPILYPERIAVWYDSLPGGEGPITESVAKDFLGWETEEEYSKRLGGTDSEPLRFPDELFVFEDCERPKPNRVHCWNNNHNRPFNKDHAEGLAQDILTRNWIGPITLPGETCNGESIIVTRTGEVDSGQHRLIGLVFACQKRRHEIKWETYWPDSEPVMESLVVLGVSDHPRVTQSLDNVKPRTLSDIYFTSGLFSYAKTPGERRDLSRMADAATNLLWSRVGMGDGEVNGVYRRQTHSSSREFLDRHPRLLRCVKHLFEENSKRRISLLRLSAGQCAALMYLMACSSSDADTYRIAETPGEKQLSFDRWDQAEEFFSLLGAGPDLEAVVHSLKALIALDEEGESTGLGGRRDEKLAVLSLAWNRWIEDGKVAAEDLQLAYDDDRTQLLHAYSVGGIDVGVAKHADGESSNEESEESIKSRLAEEAQKRIDAAKAAKAAKENASKPGRPSIMDVEIPPPKAPGKPQTRKEVEAAQTAKAAAADAAKASGAGSKDEPQPAPPKGRGKKTKS